MFLNYTCGRAHYSLSVCSNWNDRDIKLFLIFLGMRGSSFLLDFSLNIAKCASAPLSSVFSAETRMHSEEENPATVLLDALRDDAQMQKSPKWTQEGSYYLIAVCVAGAGLEKTKSVHMYFLQLSVSEQANSLCTCVSVCCAMYLPAAVRLWTQTHIEREMQLLESSADLQNHTKTIYGCNKGHIMLHWSARNDQKQYKNVVFCFSMLMICIEITH